MRDKHLQTILAVFVSFALLLAGLTVFPPLIAAFAIPVVAVAAIYGMKTLAPGLGILFLLILFLTDWMTALVVLLIVLVFSLVLPRAFDKQADPYQTVLLLTVLLLGLLGGLSLVLQYSADIGLIRAMEMTLRETVQRQIELIDAGGLSSLESLNLQYNLRQALDLMLRVLPAMLFLLSFIMAMVHTIGTAKLLRFRGYGIIKAGNFNQFKLPTNILIGALITVAGTWILSKTGYADTEILNLNLAVIVGILFLVQGLAVADCFFARRFGLLFRILVPMLLILFLQLGPVYILLGILDVPLKLRRRITYK